MHTEIHIRAPPVGRRRVGCVEWLSSAVGYRDFLSEDLFACGWWLRGLEYVSESNKACDLSWLPHLELRGPRKHLLEPNPDTLDNGKQDGTTNGTVASRLVSTSNS